MTSRETGGTGGQLRGLHGGELATPGALAGPARLRAARGRGRSTDGPHGLLPLVVAGVRGRRPRRLRLPDGAQRVVEEPAPPVVGREPDGTPARPRRR